MVVLDITKEREIDMIKIDEWGQTQCDTCRNGGCLDCVNVVAYCPMCKEAYNDTALALDHTPIRSEEHAYSLRWAL